MDLTIDEIDWAIIVHPEDTPIEGNALASGDPDVDEAYYQKLREDLEWNPWAWCVVEVQGVLDLGTHQLVESDFLGGCSYESEEDFREGGYYEDMQAEVKHQLEDMLATIAEFSQNRG